ncbi:induced myeloid leukemia cell differentiation protein Mcl-1b [Antennarius striatus]|uniref:induced myeloid leukemia cell differentiation protein Mcl-1b n=1 Tax=Antennarius striatus TaxID=241820 RepID=UPI0035B26B54
MNIIQTKRTAMNVTTGVMSFMLPQNGAEDGHVHYGPGGDASPRLAVGSSVDGHNGNVGAADPLKRPKNLRVTPAKPFAVKTLREDSDDIDDGSLPCTPELEADEPTCPEEYEVLENDTRELVTRFLLEFTEHKRPRWQESKALGTMRRVVESLLEKHRYAYNGMINKLSQGEGGNDAQLVGEVAKNLFSDGTTNWGRIASLVAFGAVVCKYMKEKGRGGDVELVGRQISTYLLAEQRDWLVKNNAWDGFAEFFRVSDPESSVRNALMACVGVFGIGATLALLTR